MGSALAAMDANPDRHHAQIHDRLHGQPCRSAPIVGAAGAFVVVGALIRLGGVL